MRWRLPTIRGLAAVPGFVWSLLPGLLLVLASFAAAARTDAQREVVLPVRLALDTAGHTFFTNRLQGIVEYYATPHRQVWTDYRPEKGGEFGAALIAAGDWNLDGHADALVTHLMRQTSGSVLLYTGSVAGLTAAATNAPSGRQPRSLYGCSLAMVGNSGDDGGPQLLVGARAYSTPGKGRQGWAGLFRSAAEFRDGQPGWAVAGTHFTAGLGEAVACVGDVNGDGLKDFAIGAPLDFRSGHRRGDVLVFHRSRSGLPEQPDAVVSGGDNHAQFGAVVAGVGDVNGDGFEDVLVGAPNEHADGRTKAGRAALYLGGSEGLSEPAAWEFKGAKNLERLGAAVAGLGDVNQDGFADFAIGAPGDGKARDSTGRVLIFYGGSSRPSPSPDLVASGEFLGDLFGAVMAGGGDVTGDGFPDLLVTAPAHAATFPREGRVYLFRGGPQGLEPEPLCTIDAGRAQSGCGLALAMVGDVDADGIGDFMVGSPLFDLANGDEGRVDLFFGSRTFYTRTTRLVAVTAGDSAPRIESHAVRKRLLARLGGFGVG
jgi:hypothetical protein